MTMNCDTARDEFSALLDGELTPEARAAVEAHLAECSECLRRLEGYRRVSSIYQGLGRVAAPDELETRVRRALRPVALASSARLSRRSVLPLLASAAALAIMIGGAWQIYRTDNAQFDVASAPESAAMDAASVQASPPTETEALQQKTSELDRLSYNEPQPEPMTKAKVSSLDVNGDGMGNRSFGLDEGGNTGRGFGGGGAGVAGNDDYDAVAGAPSGARKGADELLNYAAPDGEAEEARPFVSSENAPSDSATAGVSANAAPSAASLPAPGAPAAMAEEAAPPATPNLEAAPEHRSEQPNVSNETAVRRQVLADFDRESAVELSQRAAHELEAELPSQDSPARMAKREPAAPAPAAPTVQTPAEQAPHVAQPEAEKPTMEELPRMAPRGSGEMAVVTAARTLRYREGVWIQSEYRDEAVTTLQRDTEAWKRLKDRDPSLIDFEVLEAPVVFRAFETWYRLEVPTAKK